MYHAEMSHYDLLTSKSSYLAVNGPVLEYLKLLTQNLPDNDMAEMNITDMNFSNITLSSLDVTPSMKRILCPDGISPLVFPACPRGPGRPKKKREGAPKLSKK